MQADPADGLAVSRPAPNAVGLKVSIVVPAYNAAATLRTTLDSICNQTHHGWEAIVVNDGSTDATKEIAEEYQRIDARFRLVNQSNGGESAARNTGIDESRCEWLLFLDSDDWIAPSYLERLIAELSTDPDLDAVHCRWVRVAADGTEVPESYRPPGGDMFRIWALRSAFPVHACVVRKTFVEGLGKFDESLRMSADWDLWQRVARAGARFGVVDEVLAYYRIKAGSSSMDAAQLLSDGLRVLDRGHAPDPRVRSPHPDHSGGAPIEGIARQKFYLLAWCGGLKIGAGDSALPLLGQLQGVIAEDLDAGAIARTLFESATLPTGRAPLAWMDLWSDVDQHVEGFLAALEEQSGTIALAAEAVAELKFMILRSSPAFSPILDAASKTAAALEQRAKELEKRAEELERYVGDVQSHLAESDQRVAELIEHRQRLENRLAESDQRVADLTQLAKELEHRSETSNARVAELRRRSESLEARLLEASKSPRFRVFLRRLAGPGRSFGQIVFFRLQLLRMRSECLLMSRSRSGRRGRVLAIACWGFPIYSQSFVYEELLQLIRAGFRVRFAFSALNRDDKLPPHFRRVWRARRRLVLSKKTADSSYAHFAERMPDRVDRVVDQLSRASGLPSDEIRSHHHFRQAFAFARMAEAYGARYLHSYFFYEGTLFTFVASSLLGIPRGVSTYADHMLNDYELKMVGLHLRQSTLVVATSERIKRELQAIEPKTPAATILVKPNGIDPNRFPVFTPRTPAPGEAIGLVSVSRIEPKKGLIYLVEAAAILRKSGRFVTVSVIGQAEADEASRQCEVDLQSRVEELELRQVVRFEGKSTANQINDIFENSHIFVAPYIETDLGDKDGIPTALLEAMSSGLAVVATDAGSIPEVIEDGLEGLIVPQRDPQALAAAIARLIEDPEERARLGANAARRIRTQFDASHAEVEFHERLASLLGVPPKRRSADPDRPYSPDDPRNPEPPQFGSWNPESANSAEGSTREFLWEQPPAALVPGMTTTQERAFLYHYAKHFHDNEGALVDLGCWLGSATVSLGAGLAENSSPSVAQSRVESFDLFRWDNYMELAVAGTENASVLELGDSFLPLFESYVGPFRDRVRVNPGDLTDITWQGGPISLLFNDAAKTWELANSIWRRFYVDLIPGGSLVVEQDFAHYYTPWIHLLHWRFRNSFEPVLAIPSSPSVVFCPLQTIRLERDLDFSDFSDQEVSDAFDRSLQLVDPLFRPNVWAARVMLEIHRGDPERARALLAEAPQRGYHGSELADVTRVLEEKLGESSVP